MLFRSNGTILKEAKRFSNELIVSELDVKKIIAERRRMSTYDVDGTDYLEIEFHVRRQETVISRFIDPAPFVPSDKKNRDKRCEEILAIQSMGLKKRLEHTHASSAVVGISGGLDSTLALLVTARAFDLTGLKRQQIIAVTMPGFGTTDRTYDNAVNLIQSLGAEFREIDIKNAVNLHFEDIGQDALNHDVTYENSQAESVPRF